MRLLPLASLFVFLTIENLAACGFKAEGINSENLEKTKAALRKITSEFELNPTTGEIHFTSKEKVTLAQVNASLSESRLYEIKIKEIHH